MNDTTRPHPRIEKTEVAGKRIPLRGLNGATLYIGPKVKADKAVPIIVHFHGAPWLIEYHIAKHLPSAALITVQLGAGSSVYGRPFAEADVFQKLLREAQDELGMTSSWSSVTLTGFSAGYGAIRAILREPRYYVLVNQVLLLDGIHASYSPEARPLAEGGKIEEDDLDVFVRFAEDAAAGKKTFVLTHSEIFPGTFASTTECVDHLLSSIKARRMPEFARGPMGMQQLSSARKGRFYVFGYAGNSAPDHIDHLHAAPFWFHFLRIK